MFRHSITTQCKDGVFICRNSSPSSRPQFAGVTPQTFRSGIAPSSGSSTGKGFPGFIPRNMRISPSPQWTLSMEGWMNNGIMRMCGSFSHKSSQTYSRWWSYINLVPSDRTYTLDFLMVNWHGGSSAGIRNSQTHSRPRALVFHELRHLVV
jgi:hypothetical protein